jgi:hypothetical protein
MAGAVLVARPEGRLRLGVGSAFGLPGRPVLLNPGGAVVCLAAGRCARSGFWPIP